MAGIIKLSFTTNPYNERGKDWRLYDEWEEGWRCGYDISEYA